jgi:hypothetical protein
MSPWPGAAGAAAAAAAKSAAAPRKSNDGGGREREGGGAGGDNEPEDQEGQPLLPTTADDKVAAMVALGYTPEDAKYALEKTGGDVQAAIRFLSGR